LWRFLLWWQVRSSQFKMPSIFVQAKCHEYPSSVEYVGTQQINRNPSLAEVFHMYQFLITDAFSSMSWGFHLCKHKRCLRHKRKLLGVGLYQLYSFQIITVVRILTVFIFYA
jgi:hypothetical protein